MDHSAEEPLPPTSSCSNLTPKEPFLFLNSTRTQRLRPGGTPGAGERKIRHIQSSISISTDGHKGKQGYLVSTLRNILYVLQVGVGDAGENMHSAALSFVWNKDLTDKSIRNQVLGD